MYINSLNNYIPLDKVDNKYFEKSAGLSSDWIVQRTGIETRSKIGADEDIVTMAIDAVEKARKDLPYDISEVDLIVSAGYTMTDTIGTTAHWVQKRFNIDNVQVIAVTSACSSFVNALEIVEGYFAIGKATKALIVCSEANTILSDDSDPKSGHLWGDAAVAMFLSKERYKNDEPFVLDILTKGLGNIGKGPHAICLYPNNGGIVMNDGRDVFQYACKYLVSTMEELLTRNNLTINNVSYFVCHQANIRIVNNVARQWQMTEDRFFNNIKYLGNTGSASSILALSQNMDKINSGNLVGLTVFGGGYSSGAVLIQF